jgi:pilus assembly protein CpaB
MLFSVYQTIGAFLLLKNSSERIENMKNRTIIGIVCIVLALILTFAIAPLVNKMAESRVDIVRMKNDVIQGHQISDNDVETVKVGGYNLPANVILKKESVVGRFATTDLKAGDYLLPSKLTDTSDKAADVFRTLTGDKQAISITIQTFAGGLSGKLQNGDIVQLVVFENAQTKAHIPAELTYVKVITTTTANGADKDELTVNEDGTYELPSTVTLLVNQAQAKLLVEYENKGRIHADLVYRGDEATAQKFLDAQDDYFRYLEEHPETDQPGEETDETGEGFDIVRHANDIINGNVPAYIPGQESDGNE